MNPVDIAQGGELHSHKGAEVKQKKTFRSSNRFIERRSWAYVRRAYALLGPNKMNTGASAWFLGVDEQDKVSQLVTEKPYRLEDVRDSIQIVTVHEQVHVLGGSRGTGVGASHPRGNRVSTDDGISNPCVVQGTRNASEPILDAVYRHNIGSKRPRSHAFMLGRVDRVNK